MLQRTGILNVSSGICSGAGDGAVGGRRDRLDRPVVQPVGATLAKFNLCAMNLGLSDTVTT